MSAATSAFFALACYARPRALVAAAISGAIGTASYGLVTSLGLDVLLGSAVAAAITGFGGATMTRRLRIPTLVVVQAGVVPLLPGWTTYRGLFQLTADRDRGEDNTSLSISLRPIFFTRRPASPALEGRTDQPLLMDLPELEDPGVF